MSWTSLQMISLGSLLLFGERALVAGRSECIGKSELRQRILKFDKNREPSIEPVRPNDTLTCADAARMPTDELHRRSLSPWTYRLDHNDNRHPQKIFMAKCVCEGCIINQQERYEYNSVEVTRMMKVLYIHPCTNGKHTVTHRLLPVSVACTCALPRYRG